MSADFLIDFFTCLTFCDNVNIDILKFVTTSHQIKPSIFRELVFAYVRLACTSLWHIELQHYENKNTFHNFSALINFHPAVYKM